MKIFISWSGETSNKFALALKDWLPNIIQQLKPFVSSEDIEKGTVWFGEIGEKLGKDYQFGILCLTPFNYKEPWILFEAGALYKGLPDKTRVSPLLLGLKNADLKGPLSHFNTTVANKNDIRKLLNTLNGLLGEGKLNEKTLDNTFNKFWPDLEPTIGAALKAISAESARDKSKVVKRDQYDMIEELLETTRNMSQTMAKIESASNVQPVFTAVSTPGLMQYDLLQNPLSGGLLGGPTVTPSLIRVYGRSTKEDSTETEKGKTKKDERK